MRSVRPAGQTDGPSLFPVAIPTCAALPVVEASRKGGGEGMRGATPAGPRGGGGGGESGAVPFGPGAIPVVGGMGARGGDVIRAMPSGRVTGGHQKLRAQN